MAAGGRRGAGWERGGGVGRLDSGDEPAATGSGNGHRAGAWVGGGQRWRGHREEQRPKSERGAGGGVADTCSRESAGPDRRSTSQSLGCCSAVMALARAPPLAIIRFTVVCLTVSTHRSMHTCTCLYVRARTVPVASVGLRVSGACGAAEVSLGAEARSAAAATARANAISITPSQTTFKTMTKVFLAHLNAKSMVICITTWTTCRRKTTIKFKK